MLIIGTAEAQNPTLSKWDKNLSGYNPEGVVWVEGSPEIAVEGPIVHVFWFSRKSDDSEIRAFYRRSIDGGKTFQPKILLQIIKPFEYLNHHPTFKHMAVDGDYVHIALSRYYPPSGSRNWHYKLLYFRSTDQGANFEPARKVFAGYNRWHLTDTRIAAHSGKVSIGFSYYAENHSKNCVRLLNSNDYGTNFKNIVITNIDAFNHTIQDLYREGDQIHVLHQKSIAPDVNGDFEARLISASSSDNGQTFKQRVMTTPAANGKYLSYNLHDGHYSPHIAVAGTQVYVVWTQNDTAHDSDDIALYCRFSNDQGASWSDAKKLAASPVLGAKIDSGQETVAAKADYAYVVFRTDNRRIFLRRSANQGIKFFPRQELTAPQGTICTDHGKWPMVQTDPSDTTGKRVHVLWNEATYCYSANGGVNFTRPCWLFPVFTTHNILGLQMAIGNGHKVHYVMMAKYNTPTYGWGDMDIFYRCHNPALPAPGANHALKLFSYVNASKYNNMHVPAKWYLNPKEQLTVELWVKPSPGGATTGTSDQITPIIYKPVLNWPYAYALNTWSYNGVRQAAAEITTTQKRYWLHPKNKDVGQVPFDQWTHLAMTYDANALADNFRLYKNGQLIAFTTAEGPIATSPAPLIMGTCGRLEIDEFRLWNRVLTGPEIQANMNKPLVGDETGLQAYYNFDQTTKDLTGHGNNGILMYQEAYVPK
ncbi:MAG: LamG-like jellyroll fold domain-containing protein [Desulfobacteraceae bacterium]